MNHFPWPKRLCALLTLMLVAVPAQSALAVPDSTPITIDGTGWGHHIGIPHWATQGQASQGWQYQDILDYWYAGTQVEHIDNVYAPLRPAPDPIRVGIDYVWVGGKQHRPFMWQRFSAVNGAVSICLQGESEGACSHTAQPGETWEFGFTDNISGQCYLRRNGANQGIDPTKCETHLYWGDQPNTRVSFPGGDVSRTFARGHVEFIPAVGMVSPYQGWTGFHLVVEMPLEEYLYGLAEVPPSWHLQALKANAVASRSYAVYRTIYNRGRVDCSCDIVWDTTGQWYLGYRTNSDLTEGDITYGARWKQAVDETADDVRIYVYESNGNRRIAETYYSTISGGATENAWDMWGPDTPAYRNRYGYLGWKPDPWSSLYDGTHSGYPKVTNAVWTRNTTAGAIRNALTENGVRVFDEILSIDIVSRRDSGSPDGIRVVGLKNGSEVVRHYTGNQLQSRLGLVSHFVQSIVGFGVIPHPHDHPFTDIVGHEYEEAMAWLWERNITIGCAPTRYCPDRLLSREEMATFIKRAAALPPSEDNGSFTDHLTSEHRRNINSIRIAGITVGCSDTKYCPQRALTRAEIATLIRRSASSNMPSGGDPPFTDISTHWGLPAITASANANVAWACSGTLFCPDKHVDRAEMAQWIYRAWQEGYLSAIE